MTCRQGIAPIHRDRARKRSSRREERVPGWLRFFRLALVIYLSPVILLVIGLSAGLASLSHVAGLFDRLRRSLQAHIESSRGVSRRSLLSWTDHQPQVMEMSRRMRGLRQD